MPGLFEKPGETVKKVYRSWGIGIFVLPVLIVVALVGLATTHQGRSNWISEEMQAEFVRAGSPDVAQTQIAQPAKEMRAAKAN